MWRWVALRGGRRAGHAAVALVGLAAGLGVAGLIAASPAICQGMKWACVAYLTWESWTDRGSLGEGAPPPDGQLFRAE